MPATQLLNFLKSGKEFHHNLAAYYTALGDCVRREEVKQIVEYMKRHEEYLEQCFELYELDAPAALRQTWFRQVPNLDKVEQPDPKDLNTEMSVDEVLDMALRYDAALIQVYREMASMATSDSAREILEHIVAMEEAEERRFAWDMQRR